MIDKAQVEEWKELSVTRHVRELLIRDQDEWENKPVSECLDEGNMEQTYVNALYAKIRTEVYAELLELFDAEPEELIEEGKDGE